MATAEQIQQLYNQYLGRSADTGGLSYWQNYQGDPTAAFQAAAQQELANRTASGVPLKTYTATPEEERAAMLANQAAGIQTMGRMSPASAALGNENIPNSFTSDPNYSTMAYSSPTIDSTVSDTFIPTNSNYSNVINKIYQSELGRNPDDAGASFYANKLAQGVPISQIAAEISASKEGMTFDPTGGVQYKSTAATQPNATAQFDLNSYLNKVNDMYTQAAQASAASNLQNAQQAVAANRVNQVTPFGNVQYTQSGTDSQGNPIWTATQTLPQGLQGAYQGIMNQVSNQYQNQFNPQLPSVGINPGEQYEQAILRRLEPVQERQRKSLEVDLVNQGIMPGSEAYNRAKQQLAQFQNDQLTSAVVGGFNTGLAANQNAFNQGLTSYQLPMATLNQLRTGAQPNYVNPSQQAAVAGPDYLGAYTAYQNNQLGLQNAQNASNASLFGAGANLIGAGLMSGFWK